MIKLDREKILIEDVKPKYLWCLHCNRAYKYGEFRQVGDLQLCPYSGCDGDTVFDAWDWEKFMAADSELPEIPEFGKFYSQW